MKIKKTVAKPFFAYDNLKTEQFLHNLFFGLYPRITDTTNLMIEGRFKNKKKMIIVVKTML